MIKGLSLRTEPSAFLQLAVSEVKINGTVKYILLLCRLLAACVLTSNNLYFTQIVLGASIKLFYKMESAPS